MAQWKTIASMNVEDGRKYENQYKFNTNIQYEIKSIGKYIGNPNFIAIPKENQLPKLITNVASIIDEDLNKGFKTTEHIISKSNSFTKVLNEHFPNYDLIKSGVEFITFRNNLNKIMGAPYFHSKEEYDAFAIDIIKRNGIIYLEIVDRSEILKKDNKSNTKINSDNLKSSWWGTRFESLCRQFPKTNDNDNDNDNHRELITLIQSQLNNHKILMAAEIDALNDKNEYIEIKTQKYIAPRTRINNHRNNNYKRYNNNNFDGYPPPKMNNNDSNKNRKIGGYSSNHNNDRKSEREKIVRHHPYNNTKHKHKHKYKYNDNNKNDPIIPYYKSIKIWIQSYLAGVNNILIGLRDEKGKVIDINTLSLKWFANKINYFDKRRQIKVFKGNICLNFTDHVLNFIKLNCKIENVSYRIVFNYPWNQLLLLSQR